MSARVLRVFPSRERADQEWISAVAPTGVALGRELVTFAELLAAFGEHYGLVAQDPIAERNLLAACAARVDLGPFGAVASRPGFVRAARTLIGALKSGRCWSEEFDQLPGSFPPPRAGRARAIARLYAEYEQALAARSWHDAEDVVAGCIASLRDAAVPLPALLQGVELVAFEDVYDWSPLRLELVFALAARFEADGAGRRVRLSLPHDPERPEMMAFVDPVFEAVYQRAQHLAALELAARPYGEPGTAPARLARALFRSDPEPWEGEPAADLVSCASEEEELREVARRVRELVEAGAPPERIGVAARQLGEDGDRVVAALGRYGVPARCRRGAPLSRTAPAREALRLASLRVDDLALESLEPLLAAGAFCAPTRAGRVLEALRATGLRDDRDAHGRGAWRRGLEALARRGGRLEHEVEEALAALQVLDRAMGELPERPAPLRAHAAGLLAALDRVWRRSAREPDLAGELGWSFLQALARRQTAEQMVYAALQALAASAPAEDGEPVEPAAFVRVLADAFSDWALPGQGGRGAAVQVLDVRELVGLAFDHVLVFGMVEGRFPAAAPPALLLSEEDRARVNGLLKRAVFRLASSGANPSPERQPEDPLLLFLALCAARRSVAFTSARSDARGRECVPSPFLEALERTGGARRIRKGRGVLPSAAEAHSARELRARAALEQFADPRLRATAPDASFDAAAAWAGLARAEPERLSSIEERLAIERERFAFLNQPDREPGPFTGAIGPRAAAALAPRLAFDADRPLSPKALGSFGICRFRGFASHLLDLREREEAGSAPASAARGELAHRALELFLAERRDAGALPLAGSDAELEALERAIAKAGAELAAERPVGHPALWELAVEESRGQLRRWVRAEAHSPVFGGCVPRSFEIELGGDEMPLLEVRGPEGEPPVAVSGRLDRVDAGSHLVAAVDYKSSRADSLRKRFRELFLKGEFQLAVYAAALARSGAPSVDAAWVSLRDAQTVRMSELLLKDGLLASEALALDGPAREAARAAGAPNLGDAIWDVVRDARAGRLPPRSWDCDYCPLGPVCRSEGSNHSEEGA